MTEPTAWRSRLAAASAVFALVGVAEWIVALVRADFPLTVGVALSSGAELVGLWSLAAFVWLVAITAGLGLAFGRGAGDRAIDGVLAFRKRIWSERRQSADAERIGGLAGIAVALGIFGVLAVVFISYLIEHRHGAVLIAITAVAGEIGIALGATFIGLVVSRALRWALRDKGDKAWLRWFHLPLLLAVLALGLVVGGALGLVRFHDTVIAVDGPAFYFPAGVLALYPFAARLAAPRIRPRAWLFALPLLGAALLVVGARSSGARRLVIGSSYSAKYELSALLDASDFDRDGSPTFPVYQDCRPFNPKVHPFAVEVPGNGIDENCDGEDRLAALKPVRHAPYRRPPGPQPNLVLVTFDATRADHTGFMGYKRPTTPHLDQTAARGVVFERAFSQDSGTGPSFWSLFSGKTPFQVSLVHPEQFPPNVGPNERVLAEELDRAGYETEAVLCGHVFETPQWTIRRGFDHFTNACGHREEDVAPDVTKRALSSLERLRGAEPFFLWVHYYDPHAPYTDHEEFQLGESPMDDYDEDLRFTDEHSARFFAEVEKLFSGERPTYLIFTADHGENFHDHGSDQHARTLYREVTNVPLVVLGTGIQPRRVSEVVAMGDTYPTLLELAGAPVPDECTMVSQAPILFGEAPDADRIVFQENSYSRPRRDAKGAVTSRYHYILDQTNRVDELYDYVADPRERDNLAGAGLDAELQLRRALIQFIQTTKVPKSLSK